MKQNTFHLYFLLTAFILLQSCCKKDNDREVNAVNTTFYREFKTSDPQIDIWDVSENGITRCQLLCITLNYKIF